MKKFKLLCLFGCLNLTMICSANILISNPKIIISRTSNEIASEIIKGQVKDSNGQPVIGANITIKNSKESVNTDADGNFTINGSIGETLIISNVGFESKEVVITDAFLTIVIVENISNLSEVIVGSRFTKARTDTEKPVPVDIITKLSEFITH